MTDELFEARTLFMLGSYQAAINALTKLKPSNVSVAADRDVLLYRAHVGQRNYDLVISETANATDPGVRAVRTLAQYFASSSSSSSGGKDAAVEAAQTWASEGSGGHATAQVVAATVLLAEGRVDDALRALQQPLSLEAMALHVQALLCARRVDLAEAQARGMQQADDDATETQLAHAWAQLAAGGAERVAEARTTFQELSDRHGPTPLLLQGLAACAMRAGRWDDAEQRLLEASEKGAAREPELLANLAVCALHTHKPADVVARYVAQLRAVSPAHPWLRQLADFEAAFDVAVSKIALPLKQ